jgi:hypothetical protein
MATLNFVAADWTIDSATGNIRYIGDVHGGTNPSYTTAIDFHRNLQDFADNATSSGDDLLDISSLTPSDRSTDNIITLLNSFNIDDAASEYIYDGSIIQAGGAEIFDGIVNFGNAKYIIVHQNGTVLNDTIDFFNSYSADAGENFSFPPSNSQAGISHNFMLKVRTAGVDIDSRRLVGLTREFGNTSAEFSILGTSRGNNVLALSESNDLNNSTVVGTVATYDQFANSSEGYDNSQDINLDATPEEYYSRWLIGGGATPASPNINDLYEYSKYITRRGTAASLYGLTGDLFRGITHQVAYSVLAGGTFGDSLVATFAGGATAQILADDGVATMWVQLLTGAAAQLTGTITQSAVTATTGTVTNRSVSPTFLGQSTGSALIGAYGVGVAASNLLASDSLTDLDNVVITPPNNVTFSVGGLVVGDRVLVTSESAGGINTTQMTLATTVTGASVTTINVGAGNIPADIEDTGTLRVINDSGFHVLLNYSATNNSTGDITIAAYDFSGIEENDGATLGTGVYFTYIDKVAAAVTETFTVVFTSPRSLFIRIRDGGASPIKTFETTGSLGSAGGSTTAIRTVDE